MYVMLPYCLVQHTPAQRQNNNRIVGIIQISRSTMQTPKREFVNYLDYNQFE